jgi:hypothetical protein
MRMNTNPQRYWGDYVSRNDESSSILARATARRARLKRANASLLEHSARSLPGLRAKKSPWPKPDKGKFMLRRYHLQSKTL